MPVVQSLQKLNEN